MAVLGTKPDFSDLGYFSGRVLSKTKSVIPHFLAKVDHYLSACQVLHVKKSARGNILGANDLKTTVFAGATERTVSLISLIQCRYFLVPECSHRGVLLIDPLDGGLLHRKSTQF